MRITEHEKGSLHLGAVSFENSIKLFSREKPLSLNMKKHNSIENVVDNLQNSDRNEESVDEMKKKLKKEIDELKSIILQTECSFDIFLFKEIEVSYEQNNSDVSTDTDISEVPDINIELELELFRYAGVYCVEFSEKECVFNLSASNKYEKEGTYVVQILNTNGERRLGKWIMPESIDLRTLISKFPINETKYIPQFIRMCKHCVNCYFLRHEQCHALMNTLSHVENCNLHKSSAYNRICLELTNVYNKETNSYMNILIYLNYNNNVRPDKITVESQTKDELDKRTVKQLKASLKCLKMNNLCTAFKEILKEGPFVWENNDNGDSPLENLNSSNEEGLLESFLNRPKVFSIRQSQQIKKKRKRKQKTKSQRDVMQSIASQSKKDEVTNTNNRSYTDKLKRQKSESAKSKFQLYTESDTCTSLGIPAQEISPKKEMIKKNLNKLVTSTPIHKIHSKSVSINNISDITNNENNSGNIKNKTNVDSAKVNELINNDQPQTSAFEKMLQSMQKINAKSLIQSKSNVKKKEKKKKLKKT